MGRLLLAVIALVVGIVIGAVGALSLGGGAMMGVGAATGLTTGICMAVEAADQSGLLTPEQMDEVLKRAAENASGTSQADTSGVAGSAEQCAEVLAKLRAGG